MSLPELLRQWAESPELKSKFGPSAECVRNLDRLLFDLHLRGVLRDDFFKLALSRTREGFPDQEDPDRKEFDGLACCMTGLWDKAVLGLYIDDVTNHQGESFKRLALEVAAHIDGLNGENWIRYRSYGEAERVLVAAKATICRWVKKGKPWTRGTAGDFEIDHSHPRVELK